MTPPSPSPPFGRGLYAILDLATLGARDPVTTADALFAAGAVALQLRAKGLTSPPSSQDLLALARALGRIARTRGVPFLVNDDLDLALASEADGVHLGQEDLPPEAARARLGPRRLIGLSTHTLAQAEAACDRPVDYLGFGPVFPTRSKASPDPVQGVEALDQVCQRVPLPVVAIGGLTVPWAGRIARAGARAGAAIGAILASPDPGAEALRFTLAFHGKPFDSPIA